MKGSVGEVGGVVRRWKEVVIGLEAVNVILNIHTLLDQAQKAQLDHKFITAAENLAKVSTSTHYFRLSLPPGMLWIFW